MYTAYVNIGSNRGDRRALLARATALVAAISEGDVRVSDVVESEPWGYASAYPFLNVGVAISTSREPIELLEALLEAERSISAASHRTADGGYADRLIDIDLIAVTCADGTDVVCATPELTLPHPRMHLRRFVLEPMAQLSSEWRHPLFGLTARQMMDS